ncbi:hypothetical protein UlMin_042483 [Ulmus minor]
MERLESSWGWEQKTLISELIQGQELAKQLRLNLCTQSSADTKEFLVQRILSSYEKALLILKCSGPIRQPQPQALKVATSVVLPESPISVEESPRSDDFDRGQHEFRDGNKKRKTLPRWTDQVRVNSENGLEGPHDDGYSWRKYGQKDILGAKYPRSYYRCTYRNTQNCSAMKQVQRSDEDPYVFEITYRGKHTCSQGNTSVLPPPSPEKQDQKPNSHDNIPQQQQFEPCSLKFPDSENREVMASPFTFPSSSYGGMKNDNSFSSLVLDDETFLGSFSQPFISPATPESNYYMVSPCQMNNLPGFHNMHHSESDLNEIISATNSATNSPIPDLDFSLEQVEIDPNFPFDTPGFFA